jgi:hypothetical protein
MGNLADFNRQDIVGDNSDVRGGGGLGEGPPDCLEKDS